MTALTLNERDLAINAITALIQAIMPEETVEGIEAAEIVILASVKAGITADDLGTTLVKLYGVEP